MLSPTVSDKNELLSLEQQPSPSPFPTSIPTLTLGLFGDLGLGRNITAFARKNNNFSYSFSGVSSWLQENDLNTGNLESPIIVKCPTVAGGTYTFCGDPAFLSTMSTLKLFLNLSNNHILNYGAEGLEQTKVYLTNNNIGFVYSHDENVDFKKITQNGISLGFLGYDLSGGHSVDKQQVVEKVKQYDSQVDWLIVHLHWGNEYEPEPELWKKGYARELVDAGADLIVGHHPHVWQGREIYKGKYIYYSLGNFIFDQNWGKATMASNLVRLTITKNTVLSEELQPYRIEENVRPVLTDTLEGYPFTKKELLR